MTDDAPDFRSMLVALRSGYVQLGLNATQYLRMLGIDTEPFLSARAAALEESGVDAVIARDKDRGVSVSEQEIRAFAAVCKEGVVQACLALRDIKEFDHEVMWEEEVRSAGADKLLGIGPWRPPRRPPPRGQ